MLGPATQEADQAAPQVFGCRRLLGGRGSPYLAGVHLVFLGWLVEVVNQVESMRPALPMRSGSVTLAVLVR